MESQQDLRPPLPSDADLQVVDVGREHLQKFGSKVRRAKVDKSPLKVRVVPSRRYKSNGFQASHVFTVDPRDGQVRASHRTIYCEFTPSLRLSLPLSCSMPIPLFSILADAAFIRNGFMCHEILQSIGDTPGARRPGPSWIKNISSRFANSSDHLRMRRFMALYILHSGRALSTLRP